MKPLRRVSRNGLAVLLVAGREGAWHEAGSAPLSDPEAMAELDRRQSAFCTELVREVFLDLLEADEAGEAALRTVPG